MPGSCCVKVILETKSLTILPDRLALEGKILARKPHPGIELIDGLNTEYVYSK
jgi:hypothetical protein